MIRADEAGLFIDLDVVIEVSRWWADKAGVDDLELAGTVCRVTEKALLLDYEGDDLWIPLSQIEVIAGNGGFRSVPPAPRSPLMPLETALKCAQSMNARLSVRSGRLGYVANGELVPRPAQESIRHHAALLTWLLVPEVQRATGKPADPYTVLGVPPQASPDTIKASYQRLIRKLHPDVNPCVADPDLYELLNKRSAVVNVAYETAMRRAGAHP